MTQKRNLAPVTIYLPPDHIGRIEKEAKANGLPLAAQIRMDLLLAYPPPED